MQNNNLKDKTYLGQRSYQFALMVISFIDKLPRQDMTCQIIARQLLRSATSVGANIVEAQAGSTKRDFTNFYTHALKSANESVFWLRLLKDSKKAPALEYEKPIDEAMQLAKLLGASILTLKGRR